MSSSLILVVNAGSATLKCALYQHHENAGPLKEDVRFLFDQQQKRLTIEHDPAGRIEKKTEPFTSKSHESFLEDALNFIADYLSQNFPGHSLKAVGHRVVHGGKQFKTPIIINKETFAVLKSFEPLAPLHQPHNLMGAVHCAALFKDVPQIACFDTSFHQHHPRVADLYGLPYTFYEQGIRRYGFHGLSYEFVTNYLIDQYPRIANGRVIVAHLGNGASVCAIHNGKSIDSTLGFTALDGLLMGTRPGQLDPGIILFLLAQGMTLGEVNDILYKKSGLLGLSGISADMRQLTESSEPRARLAIDYFVHRLTREIGGLITVAGGIDALVFTAGIGENAPKIRSAVIEKLNVFGLTLDHDANLTHHEIISDTASRCPVLVIKTNEQYQIAAHCLALIKST